MSGRKQKREPETLVELNPEDTGFILEPTQVEVGSGYTVSVSYDENEKPIVDLKTYGEVNIEHIRREIERIFPHAQIRQLNPQGSVAIVKRNKGKNKAKNK